MDGCPLGLGLVVEDKPTEFSWSTLCDCNLYYGAVLILYLNVHQYCVYYGIMATVTIFPSF